MASVVREDCKGTRTEARRPVRRHLQQFRKEAQMRVVAGEMMRSGQIQNIF